MNDREDWHIMIPKKHVIFLKLHAHATTCMMYETCYAMEGTCIYFDRIVDSTRLQVVVTNYAQYACATINYVLILP